MKLQTNPHKSDQLWLSKEDIDQILDGGTLRVGALDIKLQIPDSEHLLCLTNKRGVIDHVSLGEPNIKLTFDGMTGNLKSAEVL